jgi:hypothetical protein
MLLVLGGSIGSGRNMLAQQFSQRSGFHQYDLQGKRMQRRVFDDEGRVHEYPQRSSTDEMRVALYRTALRDLPMLSKMHRDVVVHDGFHRKIPREYFLQAAASYFDPVVFVWIESDEDVAQRRIGFLYREHVIESVAAGKRMREKMQKEYEPSAQAPLTFCCASLDGKEDLDRFLEFLRTEAHVPVPEK